MKLMSFKIPVLGQSPISTFEEIDDDTKGNVGDWREDEDELGTTRRSCNLYVEEDTCPIFSNPMPFIPQLYYICPTDAN